VKKEDPRLPKTRIGQEAKKKRFQKKTEDVAIAGEKGVGPKVRARGFVKTARVGEKKKRVTAREGPNIGEEISN